MTASPDVLETTAETFAVDVFERSHRSLILLDFWAAWCAPCRRLGPILEQAAAAFTGQVVVVKADIDQLPQQVGEFRVDSVPSVFALRDGEVVDAFQGLLDVEQLTAFIARLLPSEAQKCVKAAEALEGTDLTGAEKKYREACELDSRLADAQIGLARVLKSLDRDAEALQIVEQLDLRGFLEAEAQVLKAELNLRQHASSQSEIDQLRKATDANPHDGEPKLALAKALLAAQDYEAGLTGCLEVIENYRPLREQGRETMVDALRVLGEDSPLTSEFRRKLALALY